MTPLRDDEDAADLAALEAEVNATLSAGLASLGHQDSALLPGKTPDNYRREHFGYLRIELRGRFAAGDARFDFMIQFQTVADEMPIEDTLPFRRVAKLVIPKQTFESDAELALAENTSLNPWRCLAEHWPLGGINRARKVIYAGLSNFRHGRNRLAVEEPSAP